MSFVHDSAIAGASGNQGGYRVERSLRFNSSDSAYLSRTPASAGNRKKFTFAAWIKRSNLSDAQQFFSATTGSPAVSWISFLSTGQIQFLDFDGTFKTRLNTVATFRDPSAWYHVVVAYDSANATQANRVLIYVNGVSYAVEDILCPLNQDSYFNAAGLHTIGQEARTGGYFNGYLADVFFIDGQALTPSSFTEVSATTGQLIPKQYTGSFGTNGFWLKFSDNSAATATTLGKDYSGNNNNWTPNNLSVTAGAGNDSLVDTPTSYGTDTGAGGEVRGNCATFNPLYTSLVLRNGNLDLSHTTNAWRTALSTIGVLSGKWYAEFTISGSTTNIIVGASANPTTTNNFLGDSSLGITFGYQGDQTLRATGVTAAAASLSPGFSSGATVSIAMDADAGKAWFAVNGTWINSGNPANGSGAAFTNIPSANIFAFGVSLYPADGNAVANFGQRPFAYTAPSGFKALCDTNLPAPVVAKPNSVFDVALWTGNGSARSITGLNFNPDFVWIKGRSGATDHALYDVVRGTEKRLESNTADAEVTSDGGVTAFNSDGFSLGTLAQVNTNSSTYVGWAFDGGTSTVTNTQGSITSQVRANASAGFSIVTYTGGASNSTVGHGLGVGPAMIIAKSRNNLSEPTGWAVFHVSTGGNNILILNSTAAVQTVSGYWGTPNSTTFGLSSSGFFNNNGNMVAYCFAPVAGYSSFGSYVGNGSADGPFQWCGFRPRWVMWKNTTSAGSWYIHDSARSTYNVTKAALFPNLSDSENSTYSDMDILSNGFKQRRTDSDNNASGNTYVWAAFAESPFQYARAR